MLIGLSRQHSAVKRSAWLRLTCRVYSVRQLMASVIVLTVMMSGCEGEGGNGDCVRHIDTEACREGQAQERAMWLELSKMDAVEREEFGDARSAVNGKWSETLPVTGELREQYHDVVYRVLSAMEGPLEVTLWPPSMVEVREDDSGFALYRSHKYSRTEYTEITLLEWNGDMEYRIRNIRIPPGYMFTGECRRDGDQLYLSLESADNEEMVRAYNVRTLELIP